MITDRNPWIDDIKQRDRCWCCGRKDDLKTVYLKSGIRTAELRYCRRCWKKVTNFVWPEHKKERKNDDCNN